MLEITKSNPEKQYLHLVLITLFGQEFKLEDNHLIHAIIKKIVDAKYTETKAEFWGSGNQYREITYINDLVDNVINVSFNDSIKNDIFNLGSNKLETIRRYVSIVCDIVDYPIDKALNAAVKIASEAIAKGESELAERNKP